MNGGFPIQQMYKIQDHLLGISSKLILKNTDIAKDTKINFSGFNIDIFSIPLIKSSNNNYSVILKRKKHYI